MPRSTPILNPDALRTQRTGSEPGDSRGRIVRSIRALAFTLAFAASGCAAKAPTTDAIVIKPNLEARNSGTVSFDFQTLDNQALSTESFSGRVGVLGFIATYDVASQAQARFLSALAKHHTPRINVALVVLEPIENRPLVDAFASSLHLTIPVAMADAQTIAGNGPFVDLHVVPSVVILDRRGAEVFRNVGLIEEHDIDDAVKKVEAGTRSE